jgi:hypothetical protein
MELSQSEVAHMFLESLFNEDSAREIILGIFANLILILFTFRTYTPASWREIREKQSNCGCYTFHLYVYAGKILGITMISESYVYRKWVHSSDCSDESREMTATHWNNDARMKFSILGGLFWEQYTVRWIWNNRESLNYSHWQHYHQNEFKYLN